MSSVLKYNGSVMDDARKHNSIRESHEDRFLQAFEEYGDALFRHAFLRISDRELAIDIVHDTFTKVWTYIRNGHDVDQFRPFLYKVLNNLIIDSYRKTKEISLDALLAIEGVDESLFNDLSENTVESLMSILDGKKAFEMVSRMPGAYKEVIILKFIDGLGPKEIALLLEETENVISVRIHRGLKILKILIEAKEKKASKKIIGNNLYNGKIH